jgi:hypothetical protein
MKAPDIHKTRHALMAFIMALKDDGHTAANVVAVLRELAASAQSGGAHAAAAYEAARMGALPYEDLPYSVKKHWQSVAAAVLAVPMADANERTQ